MSDCPISAAENLQYLLDEGYGWCSIDRNLQALVNWFDSDKSWALVSWFSPNVWSRSINHGQQIIFTSQQIIFVIVSVLANVKILSYHYSNAHHPKFSLATFSRWCIRVHVFSGSIGVFLPLFVFFGLEQHSATTLMFVFVAWDFVFAISAIFQTPYVFGVRVLTIPLYTTCIFFKLALNACLLESLLIKPLGGFKTQVLWLWLCWTTHQTYAWVRIWYLFFNLLDAVKEFQYTVSVFLAGVICIGGAVGFHVWVVWMLITIIYFQYLSFSARSMKLELESLHGSCKEADKRRVQEIRGDAEMLALEWFELQFNAFNSSKRAEKIALKLCQENNIDYKNPYVSSITPKSTKALMLFRSIDLNNDGTISTDELETFLVGFGVTAASKRAMKLLLKGDDNGDGLINVQEFEKHFEAHYLYAFDGMIQLIKKANDEATTRNLFESMASESRSVMSRSFTFKLLDDLGPSGCPFTQNNPPGSLSIEMVNGREERAKGI